MPLRTYLAAMDKVREALKPLAAEIKDMPLFSWRCAKCKRTVDLTFGDVHLCDLAELAGSS